MTAPIDNQSNEDIVRWTMASMADHFVNTVNASISPAPPISVTGYTLNAFETQDHVEMRMIGPHVDDASGGGFAQYELGLSFLFTFRQDGVKDMFTIDRWLGVYADALRKPLDVYKRGDGVGDDESLVGCFQLRKNSRDLIRVDRYGFMDSNVHVQQATVVSTHWMWVQWT